MIKTTRIASAALGLAAWLVSAPSAWCFYNPQTGRWFNRDPAEESGGHGLSTFSANNPVGAFDPDGRLSIQFLAHDTQPCDHDVVCWRYSLDRQGGAPCEGYLVQEVRIYMYQDTCCHPIPSPPVAPSQVFWEAFPVAAGAPSGPSAPPYGQSDCSSIGRGYVADAVGAFRVDADVKFFCKRPLQGITDTGVGNLETTVFWGIGSVTGTLSDTLQTNVRPPWWNSNPVEGPATRSRSLLWDCCPIQINLLPWEASWTP